VIARYDEEPGVYLFYCDDAFQTLTDTWHEDVEAARDQCEFEYGSVRYIDPVTSLEAR
jgi:hypothetical protein